MKALLLRGPADLYLEEVPIPDISDNDVLIEVKYCGICGSDVHYLKTLRCADFVVKEPMVIGHECAGVIEKVGSEVKTLVPGDRVALEPGISCWRSCGQACLPSPWRLQGRTAFSSTRRPCGQVK